MTRKGFIIGADLKLEFNRIPWRTGPAGQYEVDGPDCLECPPRGAKAVAPPGCLAGAGGCPPAPLPGDCGLPPEQPHPRSRFHPLPMHDVLRGPAAMPPPYVPGQDGEVIRENTLPEAVPPPGKALEKVPPEAPGNPAKTSAPFQLEEREASPSAQGKPRSTLISNRSRVVAPRAVPRPMPDEEEEEEDGSK